MVGRGNQPSEFMLSEEKRVSRALCTKVEYSSKNGRTVKSYTFPAVDCELDCDHCGWNPVVREVRLMQLRRKKGWRRAAV